MVISGNNNTSQNLSRKLFSNSRKKIEKYFISMIFCMIIAVLLITFDQRLLAGSFIIAAAALALLIFRKNSALHKQAEEYYYDLSSMNERKDAVINDFSHKMREPLNNLVIIADLLMESGLNKKQMELLDTSVASTNNMVTSVNELTMQSAWNLIYENRKSIRFNLLSTIHNTIELYNLKDKANIEFILNSKELSDFECLGDPIILKQIFLDLFNTIENHLSERAIKVTISLRKEKETELESLILIRIQTDERIVLINDKHGEKNLAGRFIASARGNFNQEFGNNYTILNILFPFSNTVIERRIKTASPKIEELTRKEKLPKEMKNLKILLVEDNLINQKITLLTLMPLVHSIETASNGKEALDKFGMTNFDLILMDIQMPVMSGLLAAEKIRALELSTNSHVPIIAITANAMIGDKEKCMSAGIDDYISKPFQPAALIEKIKNII
jgi:CheY-like chemotaxis protein